MFLSKLDKSRSARDETFYLFGCCDSGDLLVRDRVNFGQFNFYGDLLISGSDERFHHEKAIFTVVIIVRDPLSDRKAGSYVKILGGYVADANL
jgi:hypothetical protein